MQIYNQIRVVGQSCWSGDQQQLKKADYLQAKETEVTNNNLGGTFLLQIICKTPK